MDRELNAALDEQEARVQLEGGVVAGREGVKEGRMEGGGP